MNGKKSSNDDGLYDLLNLCEHINDTNETDRTNELLFNTNPINWHEKIISRNSVLMPSEVEKKSVDQLSGAFLNNPLLKSEKLFSVLSPRSEFYHEKARQNIENYLPQSYKSQLQMSADLNRPDLSIIICPECQMKNASNLEWCLSCGLFLINRKNRNFSNRISENSNNSQSINADILFQTTERVDFSASNVEDSENFDKLYKKSDNTFIKNAEKQLSNSDLNLLKSDVKSDNEDNKYQYHLLDIDITNVELNNKNNNRSERFPIIPPLDLSNINDYESDEKHQKTLVKEKEIERRKRNDRSRKWESSTMAWQQKPINCLKKKPAKFYDDIKISFLNGINVFPSRVDNDGEYLKSIDLQMSRENCNIISTNIDTIERIIANKVPETATINDNARTTNNSHNKNNSVNRNIKINHYRSDIDQDIVYDNHCKTNSNQNCNVQYNFSNYDRKQLNLPNQNLFHIDSNSFKVDENQSVLHYDRTNIDENVTNPNEYQRRSKSESENMNLFDDNDGKYFRWVEKQGKTTHVREFLSETEIPLSVASEDIAVSTNAVSGWQLLPAELWLHIMSLLPLSDLAKLQRVCRRLHDIGLDGRLWRCVTLVRHSRLTDAHIMCIARKMPKELHFKNCCGTTISLNGLKKMFEICGKGVEKLSFISCSKGALEGDQFLLLSAAFCPNVTHINASYLMNLQDSTLIRMTEGFNKIVSLNLMGAHSISNESIKSLIKNHRSSLTNLDLYGCFKLNSATLRILEDCLNLKSLALGSINKLKRAAIVDLLRKLSQLTSLDLRGTMNLIDDPLLAKICSLCPNLQQVVLTNSCLVGNEGLNSLANSNVSKTLKVLDICGCSKITDNGVEALLKNCLSLEDLDISCTGITGRITRLFSVYPPPNLKCLRVNNNKLISESELTSIVKSSKKLNTIYMCGITSIGTWRSLESKYQHILFKHE